MRGEVEDFVAASPLPTLLIRRNERILACNAAARALLGAEIEGRHFITALRQPALLEGIEACLQDGKGRQTEYLSNDGEQDVSFLVTIRGVRLEGDLGVMVSFEDTSHLEQAEQMRRDFIANVSHELRTPLTALIGFIETLKGPAREDAVARARFLDTMGAEAQRMNRLVDDLLSLSRVEAQERVRPSGRVDLAELVRAVITTLSPLAEDAQVTLHMQMPDSPCQIVADGDQLRQVLTNLVENAIKYGGAGADVTVTLSAPTYEPRLRQDGVRLTVQDTGPGIAQHHLPRLTERFYRVDTHRSRGQGGTGLGLAIVKHIINRHRGRFFVESPPGQGAIFTAILPLTH